MDNLVLITAQISYNIIKNMASKLTKIIANFETQLASTINVASTTGSLKSPVLDDDGVQVADGTYVMCVDIGNSKEEHLRFDLIASTGVMSNIYSVSKNGTETSGAVRQHRSGAKVSLTDYANLLYIAKLLTGQTGFDATNPLKYDDAVSFTDALQIVNKAYVDNTLSGLVGTASRDTAGTVKTTKTQGSKPRVNTILVREQAIPDKTLAIEAFRATFLDANINYTGGNTPNFINPALGGDFAFALNPSNGETITITVDGTPVTVTFVSTIGATAGNILIGGSASVTRANFVNFINNPTVTSANQVAVTGGSLTAIQKLSATDDASLNAFIRVINTSSTSLTVTETLAGAGNIWTVNSTKNRYDLVVVDSSSALQIRKGVEAVSPTIPTPTSGDCVLAVVFNKCGQTAIRETATDASSTNGYILEWYQPSIYRTDIVTSSSLPRVLFGDGSDGDVTISTNTTLTRDMYYNNLTINSGVTLSTANYRVFVLGTLTNNNATTGIVNNGGNASASTAGTNTAGSLLGGASGGAGSTSSSNYGGGGGAGGNIVWVSANTIAVQGGITAKGGAGASGQNTANIGGVSGSGANGGASTSFIPTGSGGKGGGVTSGGASSTGGVNTPSKTSSKDIVAGQAFFDFALAVSMRGGAGGGGGSGASGQQGGGGGGGQGGIIYLRYRTLVASGTTDVTGGAGGSAGGGSAEAGVAGSSGAVITLQVI